jgi:hypothetical protein
MLVVVYTSVFLKSEVGFDEVDDIPRASPFRKFPALFGQIFHHHFMLLGNFTLKSSTTNNQE